MFGKHMRRACHGFTQEYVAEMFIVLADGRTARQVAGREAGGGVVLERTWQFQQMGDDISVGKKGADGEWGSY